MEPVAAANEEAMEAFRPQITAALREALADFEGPDGIVADSSTWIVTARAPGK